MADTDNEIVVSVDTHAGPRLVEELRPYCPERLAEEFEAYAASAAKLKEAVAGVAAYLVNHPNLKTRGHFDSDARLDDYDHDGVAAGVIFHASENFGLDRAALQQVATKIAAPTMNELTTPIDLDEVPVGASDHAFRSGRTGWS